MTKQSRYETVGTDHSTPDTVRTEVIDANARFMAGMWARLAKAAFDRTYFENGKRVQVIIREVKEEHTE